MIIRASSAEAVTGLNSAEVTALQASEGLNELPRPDQRTTFRIISEVLREPMLLLLLSGGLAYFLLGDLKEAMILLVFATTSVVITVVQESRTERVLEALRDLTSPRALVIRDGIRKRIAGCDVVRGDIIVLGEGDRVPADATLIESLDLQADESLLTGESFPVRKITVTPDLPLREGPPGGDGLPHVFSGSLIVHGSGIARVTAIGERSEIGKIGCSLQALETEPPRLLTQTRQLVQVFAKVGGAISLLAVILYGSLRGSWLDGVLAGIALGMSMLPEEFPIVFAVFMAMGAWRISQARVLTRRATAIETLGSATVLCTDKTGTLTENRMSIAELRLPSGQVFHIRDFNRGHLQNGYRDLVEFGMRASASNSFDAVDRAFHDVGRVVLDPSDYNAARGSPVHAYSLRSDLLAVSQVWKKKAGGSEFVVASKGAPEAIADLCHLSPEERTALSTSVDAMASQGLRVLGVARADYSGRDWPKSQREFAFEFLGLVGMADPLRSGVPAAVAQCQTSGIKVVMITGDYPATAVAIADQAGLDTSIVVTGDALTAMSDETLARHLKTTAIFARIMPEQKLRIVNALKTNGEIVAMTGDGVNDAPSLKAAHIGIAMGGRGTDVAREAASIVLLDDDFSSIVKAIRLGRRIYDNLRKVMTFILAVHIPIAGLALLPLLLGMPILFWPIHIAFLEMVIDPVCSLVFEAETEEDDVMLRSPRPPNEQIFTGQHVRWSVIQGGIVLVLVTAIFLVSYQQGMPETGVRTLTFVTLVISIFVLILINRTFDSSVVAAIQRPNSALMAILVIIAMILSLAVFWPYARGLFRFGPLHVNDLVLAPVAGAILLGCLEFLKRYFLIEYAAKDMMIR